MARRRPPTAFSPRAGRGSVRRYFGAVQRPANVPSPSGALQPQGYTITTHGVIGPGGAVGLGNYLRDYIASHPGGSGAGGGGAAKPPPKPIMPPPGFYDPALDAQLRSSHRGLGDLTADTSLADSRAAQDYTFGVEDLQRQRDRGYQDVDRQVALLTRSYGELARRQAEGNAQAGVLNPAIAARQMQIRAQNMAFDRQPLDTARTRLGEDYSTGVGRLGVDFARGKTDRATTLSRARREDTEFGQDIGEQKRFQAIQAGWTPPRVPKPKPLTAGLTAAQKKMVARRTTASSKKRLVAKLRKRNR